ncbi:Serine/threonine-protein kinase rio1 [Coemansia sp. RSA 1822]|nr:Serine/threonine-protein kinase rio1 [Coemansia sp. RSA 638]KAJ2124400.1 Serine/threonine-protein kinase rio1 [Coemansia sp. RSA 720]KAJ2543692.1 Serine/threonine-protein kinase rio1 [Coemansia sp. RSA 1853]KAJ2565140.1 Serine/threonine-protein kinase rio1 [Coemansia sp. RSA 1822]
MSGVMDDEFDEQYDYSDDYSEDEVGIGADDLLGNTEDWGENGGDFTKQYNKMRHQVQLQQVQLSQAKRQPRAPQTEPGSKPSISGTIHLKSEDLNKYASRIKLDDIGNRTGEQSVSLGGSRKAHGTGGGVRKDKSDRATTEQVLDPRTRIILFKMLNQGVIYEINGCISTGKEANVYHAVTEQGEHRAIKIYKTSILVFKDRDRYVTGEHRFRHGYSRHNPRKMVRLWAEKEMRNLKRLCNAELPAPQPLLLRQHVLVMEFLGTPDGWAYPRLKDAHVPAHRFPLLYYQLVRDMRILYTVCKLVHADLSEYNILYHAKQLYIIDVSQSVEHEHPFALDFLRHDCNNVTEYFRKRGGVRTMSLRRLFEFITDKTIGPTEEDIDTALGKIRDEMDACSDEQLAAVRLDDEVFRQSYIPRTLEEVYDYERDVKKINKGDKDELIYSNLLGPGNNDTVAAADVAVPETAEAELVAGVDAVNLNEEQVSDEDSASDKSEFAEETKEEKKERQKAFKDANRERRKTKVPKFVKKRATRPKK